MKRPVYQSQILVIHGCPLCSLQIRLGGSARGHNGLRSIIGVIGQDFNRLCFGIGRPARKEDVADWVLSNFEIDNQKLEDHINSFVDMILS